MKFRKKPVVIEAVQWDGTPDSSEECRVFSGAGFALMEGEPKLLIETSEGTMQASIGDWIIKGVKGEFYPCKPDIFDATYSPFPEDSQASKGR